MPPDQQGGWVPPAQQPPGPPGWQDPNAGWNSAPGYGTPPPGVGGGPPVQKKSSPVVPIVVLVVVLIAAAVGAFLVLGGGDDDSGPAATMEDYLAAIQDGDCERMVDLIDLEDAGGDRQSLLGECQDAFSEGDLAEFLPESIASTETVSEGDDRATLAVEFRMADGTTTSDEVDFVRVDGDWKIAVSSLDTADPPEDPPTTTTAPQTTTTESTTTTTESTTTTTSGSVTSDPELPFTIGQGTDEQLQPYYDACAAGDMAACDDLWFGAPLGSEQETFAEQCGGLDPAGGHARRCEQEYG